MLSQMNKHRQEILFFVAKLNVNSPKIHQEVSDLFYSLLALVRLIASADRPCDRCDRVPNNEG